jgi:hypothetical protein
VCLTAPRELGSHIHVGYVDATSASCATVAGFVTRTLSELGIRRSVPDSPQQALAMLERVLQELKAKRRFALLCIDEFEGLDKRDEFSLGFFTSLRALTQTGLSLLTVSRSPLIDIVGSDGQTSGFFNVFEQLTLEPFSREEAQEFARSKGEQASFDDQERARLLHYGRVGDEQWSPLRLQLVGKMLLEDKTLSRRSEGQYYRPQDLAYWRKFEQRLEEKYRGVVR